MAAPTLHQSKLTSPEAFSDEPMYLTVMGPGVFETYPLPTAGQLCIGREDDTDVRIVDELASRTHARLHIEPTGKLSVEDLKSSNGTFVSGERVEPGKRVRLQLGEAITIGFTHLMVQRRRPRPSLRRLKSHAAFEERLDEACERAATEGGAAPAIVRIHIDAEDPARRGADVIQGGLRAGDLLAQYSTGDYEVLLLDTDLERAQAIAGGLGQRLRASGLAARAAVAAFPNDGRSAEALVGRTSSLLRDAAADADAEFAPVLKSEAMRALYRLADRAANGQTASGLITVLVLGETGTGKEVLANWIHRRSPRAGGPFVCINCAALTETLLESELFGYDKGAFTGAAAAKPGLIEMASGGTVFLDEIGEMNSTLQTKLLRTLESREIMRVGGRTARPIDVRFIAATNRDLEADVASNNFRKDLYFRLNGISLVVPPLREHADDVAALTRRFLAEASSAAKRRPPRLSADAAEFLQSYSWPGNVRELRNVMERALVLCEGGEITVEHLPVEKLRLQRIGSATSNGRTPAPPTADAEQDGDVDEANERRRIVETMTELGGNQTRVAAKLGIARGTLIARLERYGIKRPRAGHRRTK
jgi:two-component system, NtrC family, response regulator AtoC